MCPGHTSLCKDSSWRHHHHHHHHHHHFNLHHRHQHRHHHDHDHGLGLVDQHLMHGIVDQVPRLLRLTPKHLCSFRIHLQNISDEKGDIEPD